MARYLCLNIHTERLADDTVWQRVEKVLDFLAKKKLKAVWFVLNPVFIALDLLGEDEKKWKERIRFLAENGQVIAQHSHFYQKDAQGKRKSKDYDLNRENVLTRLRQDRQWLESQGFKVRGFLSGAWQVNKEILGLLASEGYQYDMSWNNLIFEKRVGLGKTEGILEAPACLTVKRMLLDLISFRFNKRALRFNNSRLFTLHFHDFDLKERGVLFALKTMLRLAPFLGFKIIDFESLISATSLQG